MYYANSSVIFTGILYFWGVKAKRMKKILPLLITTVCFAACYDRPSKEAIEKDKVFKDSIALADGDRVLGNIRFGINEDEFEIQREQFLKEYNDSVYGYCIQRIEGDFTQQGKLYQVKFLGLDYQDHPSDEYPFRDFLTAKFGLESSSASNRWVVGNRVISIGRENTIMSLRYALQKAYTRALASRHLDDAETEPSEVQFHNFYTMYFVSDSLRFEHARQIAEQQKAKEKKTHEEMRRKQENMEKRKENDVKTL